MALTTSKTKKGQRILQIPTQYIVCNPSQPRQKFDGDLLNSLAESIRQNGILQPLCVRKIDEQQYQLISGERRLRAAKILNLRYVPCIVMDADGRKAAVLALIENIQREDLDCFETANGIKRLIYEYNLTQEEAACRLGMAQSTLCNKLRLLNLTPWQIERIKAAPLSERHARALLRVEDPEEADDFLNKMIAEGSTAAQAEQMISEYLMPSMGKKVLQRTAAVGDIRLLANTINHAVDVIRRSGVDAKAEKTETDHYIEYKIIVKKQERKNIRAV